MDKRFLSSLLAIPTAPYREFLVRNYLIQVLSEARIPWFLDPAGNLIVGADSVKSYQAKFARRSDEPVRLFIAHLDHPGFHGIEWKHEKARRRLRIRWLGGSPIKRLDGATVWVSDPTGKVATGKLKKIKLSESGTAIAEAEVIFEPKQEPRLSSRAESLFGGFSFRKPVWSKGDLIYTKAADDLIGAATIVSVAIQVWKERRGENFLGVLTRAEEVGFVGAIAHADLGWWRKRQRELLWISLETSRILPNAEVGKGPVVRLGDRATVFHSGYLELFSQLAREELPGAHQRRIMDGGTCEATVAMTYGIPAIGISVPLGNYHNQGFQGGPDSRGPEGPAPEFVHYKDVERMFKLSMALVNPGLNWSNPWKKRIEEFKKRLQLSQSLLSQTF